MNAVNPEISYDVTDPVDTDYLDVFSDATDDDRAAWNAARQYGREILPLINGYWDRSEYRMSPR